MGNTQWHLGRPAAHPQPHLWETFNMQIPRVGAHRSLLFCAPLHLPTWSLVTQSHPPWCALGTVGHSVPLPIPGEQGAAGAVQPTRRSKIALPLSASAPLGSVGNARISVNTSYFKCSPFTCLSLLILAISSCSDAIFMHALPLPNPSKTPLERVPALLQLPAWLRTISPQQSLSTAGKPGIYLGVMCT